MDPLADMSDGEARTLFKLLEAPSLWAFSLLAGRLGLSEAVRLCGVDELPEDVLVVLRLGSYGQEHLPAEEAIRKAILGCRIAFRLERGHGNAKVCRELAITPVEMLRAQDVQLSYRLRVDRFKRPEELRSWH